MVDSGFQVYPTGLFARIARFFVGIPAPLKTARFELIEAEFHLLQAEDMSEYYLSLISYNKTKINRLRAYIDAYPAGEKWRR